MVYNIKVERLSKSFAKIKNFFKTDVKDSVLQDLNFEIKVGERVGIIGPNGSGKSTTIKLLSGILQPTSGSVNIGQYNPFDNQKIIAKIISVVFGHCKQLYNNISIQDNFLTNKAIYNLDETEYQEKIKTLDLYFSIKQLFSKKVGSLSLGQRMKCEIAISLLHNPQIIFLDEPSIGLDVIAKKQFRSILKNVTAFSDKTLILTSHDMDDIENICNRIIILNEGKIIFDDTLDKLKNEHTHSRVIKVYNSNITSLWKYNGCNILEYSDEKIIISVDTKIIALKEVLDNIVTNYSLL